MSGKGNVSLTRRQAAIVAYLFDKLPIENELDMLEFRLKGDFYGKFVIAYSRLGKETHLAFSIPSYNSSVFFALWAESPNKVANVLANLEDYEREGGKLRVGEAIRLPNADQRLKAVVLLRTATLSELKAVPDRDQIDGIEIDFTLAVALSDEEYFFRKECGHDALMDRFGRESKVLEF